MTRVFSVGLAVQSASGSVRRRELWVAYAEGERLGYYTSQREAEERLRYWQAHGR